MFFTRKEEKRLLCDIAAIIDYLHVINQRLELLSSQLDNLAKIVSAERTADFKSVEEALFKVIKVVDNLNDTIHEDLLDGKELLGEITSGDGHD